ncbi:RNA polymerase recycling motor HelD [Sporosarcina highlanderae]|uniref:RNA polymerase recycling motor HelD n=1 Tax=Sporosarcina highlanderae TaxID=3035916 RepID=A0ABT8JU82_9BACL|nr:RNA polymerase recycling motor HelD [Sporosarcina highlanderae]MDN4607739.1 RNA polymerase recycling motor HelD [Sporosarcina highlanderae]
MKSTFQQEQQRVDHVMGVIQERIHKLGEDTARQRDEVVKIRKHFWDEVKVNTDSFDDYLETIIGLRQEAQALAVSQSTHRLSSKRLSTLKRMKESPYFGRIDFIEEGVLSEEEIYIGIATLTDDSGEDFLIYDWRAPISSVYYDHQPGEASYSTPGGVIRGTLEKKWQYLIGGGVLQSMFDTSLTIGDEILQIVLGKGTDKHMHNIVATIQQEQNRIIRHDSGKLLIVHGAAGSGKTSAALQRIAYLLYKYRDSMSADQIILFSPNSLFNNYVSNVLPELGEENMQQVTFQEYLNFRLSNEFKVENPYEQLEYVLTGENTSFYQSRVAGIRFKASTPFFEAIESYRRGLETAGMVFKDLLFKGKPLISRREIEERFYNSDTTLRFHNRLEKLKDWLMKKISEVQKNERNKPWVEEEIELLSDEAYHKAHKHLAMKKGFKGAATADYEMEIEDLSRLIVQQRFKSLRKQIQEYNFIDMKEIYKQLFISPNYIKEWLEKDWPTDWPSICQITLDSIDKGKLLYEDATPFLLLNELIQGFQTNRTIKHIVVDEAQDYSPFQFEYLRRLFPAAKMTVLGDFNQAIFAHASGRVDFQALTGLYGPDNTDVVNLARSYRSTKPIIEFTRYLVPNSKEIIPFERDGEHPILTKLVNFDELHSHITFKIGELQNLGYNTIAIICKSVEESTRAYEALAGIADSKHVKSGSMEYKQGVVVIPSYLAKGIEFDAVIIYDASEEVYGDESLRRIFYTACTRAMHFLQLYCVGEPTLLLRDVPGDCYIQD